MYQDNNTEVSIPEKGETLAQWYTRKIDARLAVALPFKKEKMMRNALIAMALALKSNDVKFSIIMEAIETALDDYSNSL